MTSAGAVNSDIAGLAHIRRDLMPAAGGSCEFRPACSCSHAAKPYDDNKEDRMAQVKMLAGSSRNRRDLAGVQRFRTVLAATLITTGAGGWLVVHGDDVATGILLVGVAVTAWLAKLGLFVRMR